MLSDALKDYGIGTGGKELSEDALRVLTYGCLSAGHAGMFIAFTKNKDSRKTLNEIIKGDRKWPAAPEDRDVLYFLAHSFRGRLIHDLPAEKNKMCSETKFFTHRAKALIKDLSQINYELAQMVVASDDDEKLPDWFMVEVVRDLPRLVSAAG